MSNDLHGVSTTIIFTEFSAFMHTNSRNWSCCLWNMFLLWGAHKKWLDWPRGSLTRYNAAVCC